MKKLVLAALLASTATAAWAAIQTKDIVYKEGRTELKGYVAWDDAISGPRPGVLVIHQWTGLTDYEKGRARQLAELGYTALAVDIYGSADAPKDPSDRVAAKAASSKYKGDRALYRKRAKAGLDALKKQAETDAKRTAAIGYCFGGAGALELARMNADLKGVVSFHGSLDTGTVATAKKVKPKVLVLHGAADPNIGTLPALEAELTAAQADWQLIKYSGAVHAFTQPMAGNDPSKGAAYDASADQRSWIALKDFLQELFSK